MHFLTRYMYLLKQKNYMFAFFFIRQTYFLNDIQNILSASLHFKATKLMF